MIIIYVINIHHEVQNWGRVGRWMKSVPFAGLKGNMTPGADPEIIKGQYGESQVLRHCTTSVKLELIVRGVGSRSRA